MATISRMMTEEEFLALPDNDDVDRTLIRGELVERPMTVRSYAHCLVSSRVAQLLVNWNDERPKPRGRILTGEARIRLHASPDTFVGIDVAFIDDGSRPTSPEKARYPDGLPLLAIEILSPSDRNEDVDEEIQLYLDAGVPMIWMLDPWRRTVTAHGQDGEVRTFTSKQEIDAEPHLVGFKVVVARIFEDLDD